MELHHIQIIGVHPSETLLDTRQDVVAAIDMGVALAAGSGVRAERAPTFAGQIVLRRSARNVAADALLTQAIVVEVSR